MNIVTTIYINNNCELVLQAKLESFVYRMVIKKDTVDQITLMEFNKKAYAALRNRILLRDTASVEESQSTS